MSVLPRLPDTLRQLLQTQQSGNSGGTLDKIDSRARLVTGAAFGRRRLSRPLSLTMVTADR